MSLYPGTALLSFCVFLFSLCCSHVSAENVENEAVAGLPLKNAVLVDEVVCAADTEHSLVVHPGSGAVNREKIFGENVLTMPSCGTNSYFSYLLGKGGRLEGGALYVLVLEYPEDAPRAFFQLNTGAATILGIATGNTLGDPLTPNYVGRTAEMINYPLSGRFEKTRQIFNLHDRIYNTPGSGKHTPPSEGIRIYVGQFSAGQDPASCGAAVRRIALYRVEPDEQECGFAYPPADLPRRHVFWREEMSDGAASGTPGDATLKLTDWYSYKFSLMRMLSFNTYCRDLLEFGHNQGFDTSKYGGNAWWNTNEKMSFLWGALVDMAGKGGGMYVLPYFEYGGSINWNKKSLGSQCRARTLDNGGKYTHISWSGAPKCNADLADPEFIADAEKLLDCTIVSLRDRADFLGAWFRPRVEQNPVSFSDADLARYEKETGVKVTRGMLKKDISALKKYRDWFLLKRREWMLALRDYLRAETDNKSAAVFYTCDASEEGVSPSSGVVCTEKGGWENLNGSPVVKTRVSADAGYSKKVSACTEDDFKSVAQRYSSVQRAWRGTWGKWHWTDALPPPDPEHFKNDDGLHMSYTFNRLYTVDAPAGMELFRSGNGLMAVRHYCLNENSFSVDGANGKKRPLLGYFCVQFDRAGKYARLAEARALVNGDPRYIGYLAPLSFNTLSPEYVRDFNRAFLALPAVKSRRMEGMPDGVGAREYRTEMYGTYYAVANVSLNDMADVKVRLPASGRVFDVLSGKELFRDGEGALTVSLYSGRVLVLNVKP